jgi:hypothetical protein
MKPRIGGSVNAQVRYFDFTPMRGSGVARNAILTTL